jgi:hypothetical protein
MHVSRFLHNRFHAFPVPAHIKRTMAAVDFLSKHLAEGTDLSLFDIVLGKKDFQ